MRFLVWYLKSVFCEHDWEREEIEVTTITPISIKTKTQVSATCKKCGWHRKYYK